MKKLNLYRGQNWTLMSPAAALMSYREHMILSSFCTEKHDDQLSLVNRRAVTFEAGNRS